MAKRTGLWVILQTGKQMCSLIQTWSFAIIALNGMNPTVGVLLEAVHSACHALDVVLETYYRENLE